MPRIKLTDPQEQFFDLQCRFPLFVGGYGSGKTEAKIARAFADKFDEPGSNIALYEPTYDLARLNTVPRMLDYLSAMPLNWNYDKQANIISIEGYGKFIVRTLENPARIVGYEVWRSHVEELDTLKQTQAEDVWNKIIARNRQVMESGAANRISVYTTPEGFRFCYDRWVRKGGGDYQIVRAPTWSNPHVTEEYIQSLRDSYPEHLLKAYLEGHFVNLTSGTVFVSFDREQNNSTETIQPKEPLYIGCDFNVSRQCAVVHVYRGGEPHAVEELVDMYDTPSTIETIKQHYPEHVITIYPDATGDARKSVNASQSDIALLRQAGFRVRAHKKNPNVKDRINAANLAFEKGNYFVNVKQCPHYVEALEQLTYDKNGMPDKESGLDHITDAGTYFVEYEMPIQKKTATVKQVSLH